MNCYLKTHSTFWSHLIYLWLFQLIYWAPVRSKASGSCMNWMNTLNLTVLILQKQSISSPMLCCWKVWGPHRCTNDSYNFWDVWSGDYILNVRLYKSLKEILTIIGIFKKNRTGYAENNDFSLPEIQQRITAFVRATLGSYFLIGL